MAGEIFYLVSAAEAKKLKASPADIKKFDRSVSRSVDLDLYGYSLDTALCYLSEELELPVLEKAVIGGKDIGDDDTPIRYMTAKEAGDVARALARVEYNQLKESVCQVDHCSDDLFELLKPCFDDLLDFYEDARKSKKGVVKTMY